MDNDNIDFFGSRKRQRTNYMRSIYSFNESLFNQKIKELNDCIERFYQRYEDLRDKHTLSEFKPCCDEGEKELLQDCIIKVKENTGMEDNDVYPGVIGYYYMTMVNEYYALVESFDEQYFFNCFNKFLFYKNKGKSIVDLITTSNKEWASYIRQKINFGFYKRKKNNEECKEGEEGCKISGGKIKSKSLKKIKKSNKSKKLRKNKKSNKSKLK